MASNSYTFNFKFPWAVGLAIFMVLCVELGVVNLPHAFWQTMLDASRPRYDDALRVRAKLELLDPEKPFIAMLGSSQVREGVDTAALEKMLGESTAGTYQVLNLGISAGGITEMYQVLELVLERKPALIVASSAPKQLFAKQLRMRIRRSTHFTYSFLQTLYLPWRYGKTVDLTSWRRYFRDSFLFNVFPSVRMIRSYDLPARIPYLIGTKEAKPRSFTEAKPRSFRNRKNVSVKMKKRLLAAKALKQRSHTIIQKQVARDFLEKIQSRKIPVVLLDFPISPLWKGKLVTNHLTFLQYHRRMYMDLSEQYGIRYISTDMLPDFAVSDFYDIGHLNVLGRKKMTNFIAGIVKTELRDHCCTSSQDSGP